jgi:hypothetical protein
MPAFALEEATIDAVHQAMRDGELTAADLVRGTLLASRPMTAVLRRSTPSWRRARLPWRGRRSSIALWPRAGS